MTWHWITRAIWLTYLAFIIMPSLTKSQYVGNKPLNKLDKWSHTIKGEFIPLEFYNAMRTADQSKQIFQNQLRNFLENLQKNLTTSTVLSLINDHSQLHKSQIQLAKLYGLSDFFSKASEVAKTFSHDAETYYEVAKNSSYMLLLHLRQIPSTQPTMVKLLLTNYFAEMEFFHVMFCEILDEALEYTQNTLLAVHKTFNHYAGVQRFVLQNWNFKNDAECGKEYIEFLELHSSQIFKCAAGHDLNVAFDVFAMTEVTSKYIMRQLEFRIQRLFNCFLFGNHEIRCKFLQNAERDFEGLFGKIEELEIYYDIKTKRGRVSAFRLRRQTQKEVSTTTTTEQPKPQVKCIPNDFPEAQMPAQLKKCFYNIISY